jgi:hypothetical protein
MCWAQREAEGFTANLLDSSLYPMSMRQLRGISLSARERISDLELFHAKERTEKVVSRRMQQQHPQDESGTLVSTWNRTALWSPCLMRVGEGEGSGSVRT